MHSTRREILEILKEERRATVEDLAERLALTPMTIRHHLNVLQAQNLVVAAEVQHSQRVGRPRQVYALTEAADELFPQSYGELARHLVTEVKETVGEEETQAIFRRIAGRILQDAPPPLAGQSFEERIEQVTDFLKGLGFIVRWEKTEEGYLFANINCPYRRVASAHTELCAMDALLLNGLLGVEPKRLSSIRAGDAACTALIVPPPAE